jgi:cysteinyl-tRNA synthetase
MWPFSLKPKEPVADTAPLHLTNSLSGKKEPFAPHKPGTSLMYSCGPTVYGPAHIGNLRAYIFSDTLARTLRESGHRPKRVINITDVGHLVADAEEGEDKMAVGAAREHATPQDIADRYTKRFIADIDVLNVETSQIQFPRATDYIAEQIAMVQTLEAKGFTYLTREGVYFDTSKFPSYGKLGGIAEVKLMGGARVKLDEGKRNIHDFALWRLAKPQDLQQWDSPWGKGNPGWHIECSAMIKALLGIEIDIHTGGMDHISVHHNNEIAQSEVANERPLARYWLHNAFLTVEGEKISKSLGNDIYVSDIVERGFHPLALRYFYHQAHYRTPLTFSWEALEASNEALQRLWRATLELKAEAKGVSADSEVRHKLIRVMRDDLGTPQALAVLWDAIKDETLSPAQVWGVITVADDLLGLSLINPPLARPIALAELPEDIRALAQARESARSARDFVESDRLRIHIQERGYRVEDGPSGPLFTPSP